MSRAGKIGAIILGAVVLVIGAGVLSLWRFLGFSEIPSNIIDFHPTSFQAKADTDFFYSISDELKYSNQIDPTAPTLLRGDIQNFLVSPDNKKIAVVAKGLLLVVDSEQPTIRQVTPVDTIYREPKPVGQDFFRDDNFQWSKDSKTLYLIKDQYYQSKGSQLYSIHGELWKYEINTGNLRLILKPFPAHTYFFGLKSGIYFSAPTAAGDLQLNYFDGSRVSNMGTPNADNISKEELGSTFTESPFFSFSILAYMDAALPTKGVHLDVGQNGGPEQLVIRNRSYLAVTQGEGFKGPYYCSEMLRSIFLPGEKYFLFNTRCGNYEGQLLIDTATGQYMRLPKDTRAYLTLNTDSYPNYRVTGGGIEPILGSGGG